MSGDALGMADSLERVATAVCHSGRTVVPFSADHRASSRERAYSLIKPWAPRGRISRLAEATGLDRTGIPNYYAIRPDALHPSAIVSSGKGTSRDDAVLSALYEAYERWSAERIDWPNYIGNATEIADRFGCAAVHPASLSKTVRIPWVAAFDLRDNSPCLIPLKAVSFPCPARHPHTPQISSDTNGLAAGTHLIEAICSALFELIERDALSRLDIHCARRVDERMLPPSISLLLNRFRSHNIDVALLRVPSPAGIPVFFCTSRDNELRHPLYCCFGAGAHLDETHAMLRAITELSQTRTTIIAGVRDDVDLKFEEFAPFSFERQADVVGQWMAAPMCDFPAFPNVACPETFAEALELVLAGIATALPHASVAVTPISLRSGEPVAVRAYAPALLGLPAGL